MRCGLLGLEGQAKLVGGRPGEFIQGDQIPEGLQRLVALRGLGHLEHDPRVPLTIELGDVDLFFFKETPDLSQLPLRGVLHRLLGLHLQDQMYPALQVQAEIHLLRPGKKAGKQGRQALDREDARHDVVPRQQRGDRQEDDSTANPLSHRIASKNDIRA